MICNFVVAFLFSYVFESGFTCALNEIRGIHIQYILLTMKEDVSFERCGTSLCFLQGVTF